MGKGSKQTTGYWYPADFHHGIGLTIDKFLGVNGGSKAAWRGEVTASGTIVINAPKLYGGEKDQGGIVGEMDLMFGEPDQMPNPYLVANFLAPISASYKDFWGIVGGAAGGSLNPAPVPVGPAKISAWRGFTTVVGKNMRLGANNPYPQKLSYKIERIFAAMAEVGNWYPEKARVQPASDMPSGIYRFYAAQSSGSVVKASNDLASWIDIETGVAGSDGIFRRAGDAIYFLLPNGAGKVLFRGDPTWHDVTGLSGISNGPRDVCKANFGWLLIAGGGNKAYVSLNGRDFVEKNLPATSSWFSCDASEGRVVIGALLGRVVTTDDGESFTQHDVTGPGGANLIFGSAIELVYRVGEYWLAFSSYLNRCAFSSTGESNSWQLTAYPLPQGYGGGAIVGGKLMMVEDNQSTVFDPSMLTWSATISLPDASPQIWDNVAVSGESVITSTDSGVVRGGQENSGWSYSSLGGASYRIATFDQGSSPLGMINPAHWLYYLHAHDAVGREPILNFNDASWRAAADKLHAEGFGICVEYDPDKESLDEHAQRIGKLIGGSVTRSMIDGQLYLDLARGTGPDDDLPILTDDDVLEFRELPSVPDGAINSVSVRYFDPERKEKVITPPDVDHALVDAFGMIHQVNEYLEVPYGALAARLARRDRQSTTTPTRAFDLVTKRKPYGWRRGTYFRLQLLKRGIADMVCILADKETGTLKSGAIRIKATQDIYNLPDAAFVEVEPGGDVSAPQTPVPITLQVAYEAPYTEAAQRIPRAELAALPADVGYLQAVAADLIGQRDYTMMVADAGGEYEVARDGEWCPVAEVAQAYRRTESEIQLGSAIGLASVLVGSAGLWDDEIIRVDAKDMDAGTLTVGRACADTTPAKHDATSRIWFYDNGAAIDTTEYTDGETVDVKLLSNTTSAQLALADATAMPVTFNQRIARPYPPAKLRLNTEADPTYLFGEIVATWVPRDRVLQADQLVDTEAATIGPEAGTTYTMRTYVDDVLDDAQSAIAGITASVTPSAEGWVRIEIEAVRDGLVSWQAQVREFYWTPTESTPLMAEDGELITTESGEPIFME